ncbi:uncharacterized protein LOC112156151 [Oryzias melastigma]|uniref:uncharacterized protein LOC112156151 n=1 Tax=Oryzias melastigma TaxID=30732 RepID=UPI000CF7C2EC|nr:uncharacterized protein LOC112156151 [Oryzias melastigma]
MNPSAGVPRRTMFLATEYQARFLPPSLEGCASFKSFCFFKDNKTEPQVQNAAQLQTPPKQPSAPQRETNNNNKTDYTTTYTGDYRARKGDRCCLQKHEGNLKVSSGLVPLDIKKSKQKAVLLPKDEGHSEKVTGYRLDFSTTADQPQDSWFAAWTGSGHFLPDEVRESVKALTMKLHSQFQEANPAAERKHQSPKASEEKGAMSVRFAEKGKTAIQAPREDTRKTAPQPAPAIQTNKEVSGGKLQSAKNQSCNNQPPRDRKRVSVLKCSISLHQSFAE